MRIVFFGNERLASGISLTSTPVIDALIAHHDVVAIISHYSKTASRNTRELEVAHTATRHHIPLYLPEKPADISDQLKALRADIAVLVAYGKIIPQSIIDIFPHGIINLHPSLLPLYRGPTPIEQTIRNGDRQTGISIIQLTKEMDAGPIYSQITYQLTGHETKQELAEAFLVIGAQEIIRLLSLIETNAIQPQAQDHSRATYCQLLSKTDSLLQPDAKTAPELEREIRAFANWPKSRLAIDGHQIIVTKAHVTPNNTAPLTLSCHDNTFLAIDELITPNGKRTTPEAFKNGYIK